MTGSDAAALKHALYMLRTTFIMAFLSLNNELAATMACTRENVLYWYLYLPTMAYLYLSRSLMVTLY